jgi:hypothetical protein
MGGALLGILCVCAALAGGVLALAAMLKLAVVVANKAVGSVPAEKEPSRGGIAEWDWDDWDDEEEEDARPAFARGGRKQAIPEPGVLKCVGIVLVTAFAAGLGFVLLGFAAEGVGLRMRREETRFAVALFDLPIVALTLSVMLVASLPTGFWRAAMVSFIYGFLLLALALLCVVLIFTLRVFV